MTIDMDLDDQTPGVRPRHVDVSLLIISQFNAIKPVSVQPKVKTVT